MGIHIENMTSDITVVDGDVPLSPGQLAALTELLAARVLARQREADRQRASMTVRRSALRPHDSGEGRCR